MRHPVAAAHKMTLESGEGKNATKKKPVGHSDCEIPPNESLLRCLRLKVECEVSLPSSA